MSILVVTTGGTIGALPYEDPVHPPAVSTMPEPGRDLVRDALARNFPECAARCIALEPRDSKRIDDRYRSDLLSLIDGAAEAAVLVTHGTDTILETAIFLHERTAARQPGPASKHVVLTGSMIPLANGIASDGHANLAFALACLDAPPESMARVNVVLCDFDGRGEWRPCLYPIGGIAWRKVYDTDGRYNRIVPLERGDRLRRRSDTPDPPDIE